MLHCYEDERACKEIGFVAYTALYRRFRPRLFKEVVGQEHIVPILKNQVARGRISHAYLFSGTRGTGKTSTAQILARALRCENPQDGEPCGRCGVCLAVDEAGNAVDVIEIDAASNNSVDEVRELREKVRLSPVTGRYKVYIVDEVHMLSAGAFNALLKTLEEPPGHVVFVLATTEVYKLPATIISRCQRFDFKRVSLDSMVGRLGDVLSELGVKAEDDALATIARMAQGGMRDALGLLDQCLAAGADVITKSGVLEVLGGVDDAQLRDLAGRVIERDAGGALSALQDALDGGRDLNVFARDFMQHFRNLMLLSVCGDGIELAELTPEARKPMQEQADAAGTAFLLRALDILAGLENDMRYSASGRTLMESALVRMCADRQDDTQTALLSRLDALERRLDALEKEGVRPQPSQTQAEAPVPVRPAKQKEAPVQAAAQEAPAGGGEDAQALFDRLLAMVRKERIHIFTFLREARPVSLEGGMLTVCFPKEKSVFAEAAEREENRAYILSALQNAAGRPLALKTVVGDAPVPRPAPRASAPPPAETPEQALIDEAAALFGQENIRIMED